VTGDVVWLDVLPDLSGFASGLIKGTAKAATDAGTSSGRAWASGFGKTASDGGAKASAVELQKAAATASKAVTDQVAAVRKARATELEATSKVTLATGRLADATAKYGGESAQAVAAAQRLEAAQERQRNATSGLESAMGQLKAAQDENRTVTKQLADATARAADDTGDATGKWGAFKAKLSDGKSTLDDTTGSLGGLVGGLAAVVGGVAVFGEAWSTAMDLETGTDKLAASLDLTATQSKTAGDVAGELYAGAWGESMGEVTGAVETVMSSIKGMSNASPAELQSVTASVLDIANAFDLDVTEAARNVGILMSTGLAPDATSALDLITSSLQKVPSALRGEVTDATQEYSGHLANLGFTGEESMALLVSATTMGQYGVDKMGDSLKEFTIRSTDMSKSSKDAYKTLGLDAQDMSNQILKGGDSAQSAMGRIVDGLRGIEDPAEQANTAIALFGTPLEDLGTKNIPTFLDSLAGVGGGLGDVKGSAQEMGDTLNNNTATAFETLKRSFVGVIGEALTPFIEPATKILGFLTSVPGLLPGLVAGLGALATAWAVYTVAQWAANAAMYASGIPLIVAGIALLVAAVIAAVFVVVKNWDKISAALGDGWSWVKQNVFRPIGEWLSDIGGWFADLGRGVRRIWDAMGEGLRAGWDWVRDKVFSPIKAGIALVGLGFEAYRLGLKIVWSKVSDLLRTGWEFVRDKVFAPIKTGVSAVRSAFDTAKTKVGEIWDGLGDKLRAGKNWIRDKVFTPLKSAVAAVGDAFGSARDVVKRTWDKIKSYAAEPVNFIITTVYMNGVRKVWNKIADAVGLDLELPKVSRIKFATGGVLPGYTPGRDVHHFWSPTGGSLALSGGEAIMRPEWTRAVGGPAAVARMNASAARGDQAFAGGGVFDWLGDAAEWVGSTAATVAKVLSDPVGAIKDAIAGPVKGLLSGLGGGALGQIVGELPGLVVGGLVSKVKSLVGDLAGADIAGGGRPSSGRPMGWQAMWDVVHSAFPGASLNSAYRPGAITAVGTPSLHGQGRAIDVSPSMPIFNWLAKNFPFSTELIFSPGNNRQLYMGRPTLFGEPTRGDHWDHVHWGMSGGGVLPEPLVFDGGGWLPPGRSLVENRTGGPEALARVDGTGRAVTVTLPRELVVRDSDGALIGRMRTEAGAVLTGRTTPMDVGRATW